MIHPDSAPQQQVDALMRVRKDALTLRWVVATVLISVYAGTLASFAQPISGAPIGRVMVAVLALLATLLAAASIVVPRALLADEILAERLRLPIDAHRCARSMRLKGVHAVTFVAMPAQAQRIVGLTLLIERPYTLGLAFAGGIGLLGLVYGFLSNSLVDAAPFFLAALALNCWHYPRLSRFVDHALQLLKADHREQSAARRKPTGPRLRMRRASRPQGPVKS